MENKIYQTFAEITPEDIQDFKAKHGDYISQATAKGEDDKEYHFIIKTPTREVLDLVGQHGASKNVLASNKVLISNCVLGGDMEALKKDGGVYASVLKSINGLVKKYEVTVKKL